MAVFVDDFQRANGALGGNWTVAVGGWTINNGFATQTSPGFGLAYNSTLNDTGRHEAVAICGHTATYPQREGPVVKYGSNGAYCYWAYITGTGSTFTFNLCKGTPASVTVLASTVLPYAPSGLYTIRLIWDNGALSATIDGEHELTASDSDYLTGPYMGMVGGVYAPGIASVSFNSGDALALSVNPDAIGNYGACTELELTGTGTSWTPGTPGSPTFTVDHGTITAQTVNSATSATITYCPGDYLGPIVFTDPSTGQTDTAVVTSDTDVVPPGDQCPFNQDFIDMANLTPDVAGGSLLATGTQITTIDETQDFSDVVSQLWRGLFLGETPIGATESVTKRLDNLRNGILGAWEANEAAYEPVNVQPVKADTDQILSFLVASPNNYANLADIVALLGGSPTVLSHQDLKTAIDNISGQIDLSAILDKLDSIQGSQLISITDLAGQLQAIRTIAGYSLGDVLAAIGALNPATAPGLAAALATILGSLGALALEIAAIGAAETEDAAASSAGAVSAAGALAWLLANGPIILGLLNDLKDSLGSSGNAAPHPPVWPGLANVDLGAPVDLATTNTLAGPMHGVLLDITSADPGTNRYVYDTVPAWKNIGALSFFTDTGHHETYQALSFAQALYVPKAMAVAGGVRVFHGRGPQGTIRPWSYKT